MSDFDSFQDVTFKIPKKASIKEATFIKKATSAEAYNSAAVRSRILIMMEWTQKMVRAPMITWSPYRRQVMMIALFFVLILVTLYKCTSLGMDWYLSVRYWFYAMPSLFSELYYGAPPYTYFSEVAYQFSLAHPFEDPSKFKSVFDAAMSIPDSRFSAVRFFPADEKGTVDFVRIAFVLFGVRVESIFYLYFSVLAISIALFVFRFRNSQETLLFGLISLAAFYVAICVFPVTKEVYSVTNPRAIGGLSLFSLLHLSLLSLRCQSLGKRHLLEILFQSAVLVLVVSMRTAEIWQFIALSIISIYSLLLRANKAGLRKSAQSVLPLLIALTLLGGYYEYQNRVYPAEYFKKNVRNKIFWHNVLIGFSLNPEFSKKYGIDVSDTSVLAFIKTGVKQYKQEDFEKIFWPEGEGREGIVKNYAAYEKLCEGEVWRISKENPYQTIKLFLYYKPRQFLRSFEYAIGRVRPDLSYYSLADQQGSLLSAQERITKSAFLNPFALVPILSIVCGFGIAGYMSMRKAFDRHTLVALLIIWLASLLPGFVTYPLVHVITDTYFTTTLLFYALLVSAGTMLYQLAQPGRSAR